MLNALRGFPVRMEGNNINVTNTGGNNYRLPQILEGADLVEKIQMRMQQRDVKTPAFMKYAQDVFDTQGYPTKTMQEYADLLGEPGRITGQLGGAMIPEQGPLGPGLVGGIPQRPPGLTGITGMLDGPNNPMVKIGGGSISQGEYFANYGGSDVGPNINTTPIDNTGIGSLTPTPVNQIPESSSIAGSMTSPYMNNNQDFDQYLNSYINNQINTRMRDIFSGIMNIFK